VSPRRTRLGTRLLILVLAVLGVLLVLFALGRPSAGRFLAGGLLLAAAVVVRYNATRAADPARYSRAAQVRSLVWSVLIAVVFIGVSLLVNELLTD
jgi:multisubunit Na+/H+ antiporter MnhB subunit